MTTMKTVTPQALELTTPDLDVINSSLTAMLKAWSVADVAFSKTQYLPDLHASCRRWYSNAVNSRATLNKVCRAVSIEFTTAVKKFNALNNASVGSTDPVFLEEINVSLKKLQTRQVNFMGVEYSKLAKALDTIDNALNTSGTKSYLIGLEKDTATFVERIDNLKQDADTLTDQRKVLTDAIEALEGTGLINTAQDLTLTGEKIISMGLLPPQAALIALALEQMRKTLEDANAALNYLSLIAARNIVRERIEAKTTEVAALEQSNSLVAQRVLYLNAIHDLNDQQLELAMEFTKVVTSFRSFLAVITKQLTDEDDGAAEFFAGLDKLTVYVKLIG